MLYLSAAILSAALLLAMILNLALKPSFSARLTTGCMVAAVLGGLLFYGVGFAETTGDLLLTIIRTPLAVIRMFVGVNELSAIAGSSLVSGPVGIFLFWLLHLLAFYSMASAAMITLGAEALRYLRLALSRRGDLVLIYGINDHSIALGTEYMQDPDNAVVYIAETADSATVSSLNNLGMSVLAGQEAVSAADRLMRRLRLGSRKVSVYALDPAPDKDLFFALKLKDALERAGARAENTRLTLPGEEEILAPMLQVSENSYGFGYVNVFEEGEVAGRALIDCCPPWDYVGFGPDGRARSDFSCAIVGFGRFGQAALKHLIMNAQFVGSTFRATVFSPRFEDESGYLFTDCPELQKQFAITGICADGRSKAFYDYIQAHLENLKMVVVATGSEAMDREIAEHLMLYLKRRQAEKIAVIQLGRSGVRYQETVGGSITQADIYTRGRLAAEEVDRRAIKLNNVYAGQEKTAWENWVAASSFDKISSRASGDFAPAFLRIALRSREDVLAGNWPPEEPLLEVLGETEHLRWCAFHYANGYTPMTAEELGQRAARGEKKIAKDALARKHACLVPWEELDALSTQVTELTGQPVDYKKIDIENVVALPQLLEADE